MLKLFVCLFFVASPVIASSCSGDCDDKGLVLSNNRYDGLVIAINPQIEEKTSIIENLKNIWTDASKVLLASTNNRAYFGDITILIPRTWKHQTLDGSANKETYENAHVVVAEENSAFGNSPYTLQYGECGEPGQYIHLTEDYVLSKDAVQDYGPKGKTMVHEWAHFRWGVYDESPTPGSDPFYFDGYENIQATKCPVALEGRHVYVDTQTGEPRDCQITAETRWLPEDGCMFLPNIEQNPKLNASLLSHYYLDDVVTFCHDDESDPMNKHNHEAPNEHNRLCQQQSVWSVIKNSSDFNGDNFPNPNIINTAPNFKVVQAQIPRFILVLDLSGSMGNGDRFPNMMLAATTFVSDFVTTGSAIGIVRFASSAVEVQSVIEIKSESDKTDVLNHLKNIPSPYGGTCIGCGINKAMEILDSSHFSTPGAHIVVLTDGEETTAPLVKDIESYVCDKGVVIDSIFFGTTTNVDLQTISEKTCGEMRASGLEDVQDLIESFKGLSETNDGDNFNKVFQIFGESHTVGPFEFQSGHVPIDSTIGNSTIFTITWSQYSTSPRVDLTSPAGEKYCSVQSSACPKDIVTVDSSTKTIKFVVPGMAEETGLYEIQGNSYTQVINVMVTSMASDPFVEPIVVKSTISSTSVTSGEPIVVNAMVTQGYVPIIGAMVEATITNTDNDDVSYLTLFDDGSAPDVRKHDGVYSRYFIGYSGSARYSVKIVVTGVGNTTFSSLRGSSAAFIYGYIDNDDSVVLNPSFTNSPNGQTGTPASKLDPFKRIESAGSFSFSGQANTPSTDNYPPSQVIDLSVQQIDPLDATKGVLLTFTAPGDNYDEGTASSYVVRYTYDNPSILTNSFSSAILVSASQVLSGNLSNPSVANTIEKFEVNLTDIPKDKDLVTVAFALRATDDVGNTAKVSNIDMMNLFLKPPAVSCSDEKGNPISGDPFEKPGDCTHFYQCSNGQLKTLECKDNTAFNPVIGTCDNPENVTGCGDSIKTVPVVPPTTNPSVPAKPTCIDDDGKPMTTLPFENENDCSEFYQCSNGYLYVFDCPAGLAFNPQQKYCDWPANVPGC